MEREIEEALEGQGCLCEDELFEYVERFRLSFVGFYPMEDAAPWVEHFLWAAARVLWLCGVRISYAG